MLKWYRRGTAAEPNGCFLSYIPCVALNVREYYVFTLRLAIFTILCRFQRDSVCVRGLELPTLHNTIVVSCVWIARCFSVVSFFCSSIVAMCLIFDYDTLHLEYVKKIIQEKSQWKTNQWVHDGDEYMWVFIVISGGNDHLATVKHSQS